jgi:hypothetical protein
MIQENLANVNAFQMKIKRYYLIHLNNVNVLHQVREVGVYKFMSESIMDVINQNIGTLKKSAQECSSVSISLVYFTMDNIGRAYGEGLIDKEKFEEKTNEVEYITGEFWESCSCKREKYVPPRITPLAKIIKV